MVVAEAVAGTSVFAIKTFFTLAQLQCYENHPAQSCSRNITNRDTFNTFLSINREREEVEGHNHMVEEV